MLRESQYCENSLVGNPGGGGYYAYLEFTTDVCVLVTRLTIFDTCLALDICSFYILC